MRALDSTRAMVRRDSSSTAADSAFFAAKKHLDGLVDQMHSTLPNATIAAWSVYGSRYIDDSLSRFLAQRSLRFYSGRGDFYMFVDDSSLAESFGPYLSRPLRRYLTLLGGEEAREMFSDGSIALPWDSLGERAAAWERFIGDHPTFGRLELPRRLYKEYLSAFLIGTGNTPAFPYGKSSRAPDLPMDEDVRGSLRSFPNRHPGTRTARLVTALGHTTPIMTLRYMKHAPEAFLDEDAKAIANHLSGVANKEADARAEAARAGMKAG